MAKETKQPLVGVAAQRSKLLADILRQNAEKPPAIQSGAELGVRLLAQGLTQYGKNKADQKVAAEEEQKRQALMQALQAAYPNNPAAAQMAALFPDQAASSFWDIQTAQGKPLTMGAGATGFNLPGQSGPYTAPELRQYGNQYGTQTAQGYTPTGAAPASIEDVERNRANLAGEDVARGQLGVAQGNLGVRQQEFQERKRQGGFGTPGVGGVLGPTLGSEWEIQ